MTDHETRIRLAEAMGWTDVLVWPDGAMSGVAPGEEDTRYSEELPDPLEDDRDAARLRAWCVGRGWELETVHVEKGTSVSAFRDADADADEVYRVVQATDEPDLCRRERLALCRAVLQGVERYQRERDAARREVTR